MLRSIRELQGYRILALDDKVGSVNDFYFDDQQWIIRYMVVDTGRWLPGRKVLISPVALGHPDWNLQQFPVNLTKQQIKNSPDIDTDKPASRQQEIALADHYEWPHYWEVTPVAAQRAGMLPETYLDAKRTVETETQLTNRQSTAPQTEVVDQQPIGNPNLRSANQVINYYIQALDDEAGHVEDFIVDEQSWLIRYIVVDTQNWLPGEKVLIPPEWISAISWTNSTVTVNVSQETIRHGPKYDPTAPVNREYETRLYDYYGRPAYWR